MSTKDDAPSLEQPMNEQPLVVARNTPVGTKDGEWTTVPGYAQGSGVGQIDPMVYAHALRRHWLLGIVIGIICAVVLGVAFYLLLPKNYTASALIQVAMQRDAMLFDAKRNYNVQQEFIVYKNTQIQWLKSPFVLNAALRESAIAELEMVKQQNNPILWLQDNLRVWFPGDAEIMEVSLTGRNKEEVTDLVNAVVEAYQTEIVETEMNMQRRKHSELERLCREKENELRTRRASLKDLAERNNASDKEALSVAHQVAIQQYGESRRQLANMQFELGKLRSELKVAEATLERIENDEISDFQLEELTRRDPICKQTMEQLAGLSQVVANQDRTTRAGVGSKYVSKYTDMLASVQQQYDTRVEELREVAKGAKRAEVEELAHELRIRVALAEAEATAAAEDVAKQQAEVAQIGRTSVEIEMMRADIATTEMVHQRASEEREALRIGLRSPPRVDVRQPAELPTTPDHPKLKVALTLLVSMVGLALPLCGIVLWDVRKRRINSPDDVAKGLGVPVIGAVPVIPSRAIRRLHSPNAKNQLWNVRLTESIDSIAAKLLRNAAVDQDRVVLITSAVSGEGKTTLATQVAMSLARAGRRTVLVDFDLRRPAIDKAFGVPLHPGVSEALCGETDILSVVQTTSTKNLSVVTAGRCDRHALQALSNGVDQKIFEQLRAEYDFIVVDGSPILPVADSRYVSQHVDSVVLSVFRDYSRAPKVMAACQILESFGVRDIEAVVTSSVEDSYGLVER